MKLAPVFIKYLVVNKELHLPGLGVFYAESAYDPNEDNSKKGPSLVNINFEQKKVLDIDESLINFVSAETGKMKILAKSDISSELDGAISFLNTGKPYYISGLGTLTKKMDGSFEFHKEKYHHAEKETKKPTPITEKNLVPQTYIDGTRKPKKYQPAIIILSLCILAVAATVWFYIKNSEHTNQEIEEVTNVASTPAQHAEQLKDTIKTPAPAMRETASTFYKYILEIATQPRASKRYNQLKKINWPVEIATTDSVQYKLFILLPKAGADTTKIKDSLSVLSGKKVWIDQ